MAGSDEMDDVDLDELREFARSGGGSGGGTAAATATPGGGGKGGGGRGPRRWVWLVVGLAAGIAGTLFLPDVLAPYLPAALRPSSEEVRGPVLGKRVEGDRLLLTVDTEKGAMLVTFRQDLPEIDLLVEEGDTVTLGIPAYRPLVEDPLLEGVKKGPRAGGEGAPATGPGETPADTPGTAGAERDTVPGEDTVPRDSFPDPDGAMEGEPGGGA